MLINQGILGIIYNLEFSSIDKHKVICYTVGRVRLFFQITSGGSEGREEDRYW